MTSDRAAAYLASLVNELRALRRETEWGMLDGSTADRRRCARERRLLFD
jgi:hypothetical protein